MRSIAGRYPHVQNEVVWRTCVAWPMKWRIANDLSNQLRIASLIGSLPSIASLLEWGDVISCAFYVKVEKNQSSSG